MKKLVTSVALSTLLLGGLTACGTANNNESTDPNAVETQNYGGNYNQLGNNNDRNQGPITDMLTPNDRYGAWYNNRLGDNTRISRNNYNGMMRRDTGITANYNRYTNRGMTGNNVPNMVDRDGMFRHDRGFVDGQTTRSTNYNRTGYYQNYDSRTAKRIANSVAKINGVRDARVVVRGNDIIVGIETTRERTSVQREVENRVKGLTTGKNVYVVTDKEYVGRIRTLDDRLRNGTAIEEVGDMFGDIINDLGNAAARPFQGVR